MSGIVFAVLNFSFCRHKRMTSPFTSRGGTGKPGATHVTCLDCGRRFEYDLAAMRRRKEIIERPGREIPQYVTGALER